MTEPAPYRTFQHFIGIDPGPIPGIVMLTPRGFGRRLEVDVVQCSESAATAVLWGLLDSGRMTLGRAPALVQIERFVVSSRSGRSSTAAAGATTRTLIGRLQGEAENQPNVRVVLRSASEVKPWATDERLAAAGLLDATRGMRHARDAARHALYCAVKEGRIPDPLSKAARS